jgi:hypothetical protein
MFNIDDFDTQIHVEELFDNELQALVEEIA